MAITYPVFDSSVKWTMKTTPISGDDYLLYLYGNIVVINYGILYNWYAAADARKISSSDNWVVPSSDNFNTLITNVGGSAFGGNLKEAGLVHWLTPNSGATNSLFFNARGAGYRTRSGDYLGLQTKLLLMSSTLNDAPDNAMTLGFGFDTTSISIGQNTNYNGYSIRLVNNSTSLSDGQTGIYVGNDGNAYWTICIGGQEWLANNLIETKYRDGSTIPIVPAAVDWAAITAGACCAFNNDWNNV